MSAIEGPNSDGCYQNIPHVLAYAWSQSPFCMKLAPADTDECVNRFYKMGVEHIAVETLRTLGSYVVVNDLGSSFLGRGDSSEYGIWPYRVRIYGPDTDQLRVAFGCLRQGIADLGGGACFDDFIWCDYAFQGHRWGQFVDAYFREFTLSCGVHMKRALAAT